MLNDAQGDYTVYSGHMTATSMPIHSGGAGHQEWYRLIADLQEKKKKTWQFLERFVSMCTAEKEASLSNTQFPS